MPLTAPARATAPEHKDVFDVIGATPEQVASAMAGASPYDSIPNPRPMVVASPWVGLPMTADHRKQFIEELRRTYSRFEEQNIELRDAVLDLLEEDGRVEEALEFLAGVQSPEAKRSFTNWQNYALVRRVGFLIKAGRKEAALQLVASSRVVETTWSPWTAITAVDLAMGRSKEVIDTLEFLLRESAVDGASFALLARQQLQVARAAGGMDAMIAADVPPVLRAVRLDILGRSEEAATVCSVTLPTLTATEMFRLLQVKDFKNTPGFDGRMATLLDSPNVPPQDKANLIRCFEGREKRLDAFFAMKDTHDKVLRKLSVAFLTMPSGAKNDRPDLSAYAAQCDRMLGLYPEEPEFHFLKAACVGPSDPSYRTSLEAVVQSGTMDSRLAHEAINLLKPISTADELDRIITQAISSSELSVAERVRLFREAELDQRVVEMLDGVDFSKPEGDSISSEVGFHLSCRSASHEIPAKVVERILPILTPLCVGSPEKGAVGIQSSISNWFTMLSRVKAPDESLNRAAKEIAAIVEERKIPLQGELFQTLAPEVRQAAGIATPPPVKPRDHHPKFEPWAIAIEILGHPEVAYVQNPYFPGGMGRMPATRPAAGQKSAALELFAKSPWKSQGEFAAYGANLSQHNDKPVRLAAMVRGLVPADARRAGVYDSLVATSLLPCADAGLKELAVKHAEAIAASPVQENPELIAFLYVSRFGKEDGGSPNASPPPDLTTLLPHEKQNIREALEMSVIFSRNKSGPGRETRELLEKLHPPQAQMAPAPPPPLAEISDYDRMKSLEGAGRDRSEEALTLARTVLDKFVNERKLDLGSDLNMAVHLLVKAGEFEAYLGQTRERFAKEAWPEADIQRTLMRLHGYRIIHPVEAAFPYAKRLFELVPTDLEAAEIVCEIAMKQKDADTVRRCLVAMAAQSGLHFRTMLIGERGRPLSLFQGEKAAELIRALVAAPMEGTVPDYWDRHREFYERSMLELLVFGLNEAPKQFDVLRVWSKFLNSNDKVLSFQLAEAMKTAGMPNEAVRMLAEHYFSIASKQSTEPLRFKERQRQKSPVERQSIPIRDLAKAGLLDPLAALAAATEPSDRNRGELAVIRLAASPTMKTWKSIVQPALAATPISDRNHLRNLCFYAATQVDGSEELRVLIAVEEIRSGRSRDDLFSLIEPMKLAASLDAADRDELFPVIWKRASEILSAQRPKSNADRFIGEALRPMIVAASDSDWQAYLEELRKAKIVVDRIAFSHGALPTEAASDRLRDIAAVICKMVEPGKPPGQLMLHLIAKLGESGDFDNDVAAFRPLVFNIDMTRDDAEREDRNLASIRRLIELMSGDASAILPVLDVQADERGDCQFRWSLTGTSETATPSPRDRRFKQFDGRFDVVLLAGPEPRRLSRVAEQSNVPGDGTGRCEIPPASRFAALMVTERNGSVVHWTDPVAVWKTESWQDLPLPEKGENSSGPFDDTPARDFTLDEGAELLLADVPWDEGPHPSFSIWALEEIRDKGAGSVFIRYINEVAQMQEKSGSEYSNYPVPLTSTLIRQWSKLELPNGKVSAPPWTTRIQLVYRGPQVSRDDSRPALPGRASVSLAGFKMHVPVISLPKGVEKLGRVAGSICGVAFDAEGNRIAFADRNRGVGVFNMDAKTFGGWIPLAETPAENAIESLQLKIVGNRIFHIDDSANVRVIDLKKRSSVILNPDAEASFKFSARSKMSISQDGSFVALSYPISGYEVFSLDEDGNLAHRTFTSAAIWNFAFDEEKKVLLAGESNRIWTLPLADWKTAEPQLSAGNVSPRKEKVPEVESSTEANLDGRRIGVSRSSSSEWKLISSGPTWATILVPGGKLFQAGNEQAWLITPGGSIYRIAFGEVGR